MKKILLTLVCSSYIGIFILGSNLNLEPIEEKSYLVKATAYTIDEKQTDSSPLITASGFKLHSKNPKKHKIIAVSRDLAEIFPFGTKVRLENVGKYNGIYVIRDLMNKRFKNRVDILINPKDRGFLYDSVKLYLVKE